MTAVANLSAIGTAFIAASTAFWFFCDRRLKQKRLEEYLKSEKKADKDKGQRTVLHLMTRLGMTEAEVLQASFRSTKIRRRIVEDRSGRATAMLMEYTGEGFD